MKIALIRDRYEALDTIARRALPSATAENKVTFLQQRLQRQYEVSEKRRKLDVIEALPAPEGVSENALPADLAEARQKAWDAIAAEDLPVKAVPDRMRLTKADMPRALKGDDGWKNATGIAALRRLLGSLYVASGEELVDDQPDGFEPDDASAIEKDPMDEHIAGPE